MGAIQDALTAFGNETVQIIQSNLASTGTNASGETSQSLNSTLTHPNRVQVTGKPFIYVVETGRKPRESSESSGLESKLEKWINIRGLQNVFTAKGLAWYINKFGSKLFREGGRDDIITPAVSDQRIDKLTE
ncbi:unnamed protein product, partial [marine sediment metagenome]